MSIAASTSSVKPRLTLSRFVSGWSASRRGPGAARSSPVAATTVVPTNFDDLNTGNRPIGKSPLNPRTAPGPGGVVVEGRQRLRAMEDLDPAVRERLAPLRQVELFDSHSAYERRRPVRPLLSAPYDDSPLLGGTGVVVMDH